VGSCSESLVQERFASFFFLGLYARDPAIAVFLFQPSLHVKFSTLKSTLPFFFWQNSSYLENRLTQLQAFFDYEAFVNISTWLN